MNPRFIFIFFLVSRFSFINGLRRSYRSEYSTEKGGSDYSEGYKGSSTKFADFGSSSDAVTESKYIDESLKVNVQHPQGSEEVDIGEEKDGEKDIESSERSSNAVTSGGYSESEADEEIEVGNDSKRSSLGSAGNSQAQTVDMPKRQYMSRQQKFNLASTVYPASDVSSTNYVFLSPAAQRRIDNRITKLQREGRHHGSMKETKAVGEWQKRYYSRPATDYGGFKTVTQKKSSSILVWAILGLGILVLLLLCFCAVQFLTRE